MIWEINSNQCNDPKQYWRLLNKETDRTTCTPKTITIESLYEFSKNLNEIPTDITDDDQQLLYINYEDIQKLNHELNTKITSEEIVTCTKNLKNNKACADDQIIYEYI